MIPPTGKHSMRKAGECATQACAAMLHAMHHRSIGMHDCQYCKQSEATEPLQDEMRAFITCCQTGHPTASDIAEALNVQIVLDQMQTTLIDTNHSQD